MRKPIQANKELSDSMKRRKNRNKGNNKASREAPNKTQKSRKDAKGIEDY